MYTPGEILVDPPFAAILMDRGYLQPVPDDFTAPTPVAPRSYGRPSQPKEERRPTVEEALAAGNSQEDAEALAAGTYVEGNGEGDGDGEGEGNAEGGNTEGGASSTTLTLKDLLELSRKDLNELAAAQGIETPELLENKQKVAEAILAAAEAEDAGTPDTPADTGSQTT